MRGVFVLGRDGELRVVRPEPEPDAVRGVDKKGDNSSVVTAADTRSEGILVRGIRQRFSGHSIIAEEAGCDLRHSEYTWVVAPLDGTLNYAAGIPWFGVLICVLCGKEPIAGVIHTPVSDDIYTAEAGAGAYKNGMRISVAHGRKLARVRSPPTDKEKGRLDLFITFTPATAGEPARAVPRSAFPGKAKGWSGNDSQGCCTPTPRSYSRRVSEVR